MKPENILRHKVQVAGPVFFKLGAIVLKADSRDIVYQRVHPYVYGLGGVKGKWNAPGEGGTGYADIFEADTELAQYFVASFHRLHRDVLRMVFVTQHIDKLVPVRGKFEEIVFFRVVDRRGAVIGTATFFIQIIVRYEFFALYAIRTLVLAFVDCPVIIQRLHKKLNRPFVTGIRSAYKTVVRDVHRGPRVFEPLDDLVTEFPGRLAVFFRGLADLGAVLIGAGQKKNVISTQAMPACENVGRGRGVRVADMGDIVNVINWSGQIKFHDENLLVELFPKEPEAPLNTLPPCLDLPANPGGD